MKRILIIGLGSIGRRHTRNLAALYPDSTFVFLRHSGQTDSFVHEMGGTVETSFETVLNQKFDLAVVSSPSANHIDVLPRLIASGVKLFVEKPIVTSLEDCDSILQALADAPDAVRASGFNFRYIQSLRTMHDMIVRGELGTIVRASFVAGQWLPDWRPDQDYRKVYSADAARGGGVELDLVHEIDVARWFLGNLELNYAIGRKASSLAITSNDVSSMIFTGCEAGKKTAPIVHVSLDYVSRKRVRQYEIVGDAGSLFWDISGTLHHVTAEGRKLIDQNANGFDVAGTYVTMMAGLFESTEQQQKASLQSLEDGIASSRLAILAQMKGSEA
jgi:predicted dehydrogenase